jgi:integrase
LTYIKTVLKSHALESPRYQDATAIKSSSVRRPDIENNPTPTLAGKVDEQGQDRCAQTLNVKDERREGYFAQTPDFAARADKAREAVMSLIQELRESTFSKAADKWLEHKSLHIRESTINCYLDYLVPLRRFYDPLGITLQDIHIGHIEEYQRSHKKNYHPASVNHHINTLSQIMRKAELWAPIAEHYHALPLPENDPPKVMSEEEENRFFEFASKNPEWWLAYWVASLTNNSTASGKELRMLQLGAINLEADPPYFQVPKNMKTLNRPRRIPLNERGARIMERLLGRARAMGSTRPEHHLFPLRVKRNFFDPTRPASESWLRYRWKLLVGAARNTCRHCSKIKTECECPKFEPILSFDLKPHNLRHQIITKLLEAGVPIETVRHMAGHGVDSVATRLYSHGRMEVMARALDAIDPDRKKPAANFSTAKRGEGAKA